MYSFFNLQSKPMSTINKSSKLSRILGMKCPRCGEGDLFYTPTFSFKRPLDMHETCTHCKLSFFPEPGFYYGAMFVSYITFGFFSIGLVMLLHWVLDLSVELSFAILIAIAIIFYVFLFRMSRSIWLGLMVKKAQE